MEIALRDLGKSYGNVAALQGIRLDIASGELLALLGPSGSGKTTLLRAIAGLETIDQGSIRFGDIDATQLSVQERRVGFVFQHYALFKHMNVLDNITFGLRMRKRARRPQKSEIHRRGLELLELVQLNGLEKRYPAQLSGGQRQRVALARALAIEPRVLLLDEPFGALDAKVRRELRAWLRQLHDETGYTTIFVTHDENEAQELADRVVVMNAGRVEQVDTPEGIQQRPATPFVADFIERIHQDEPPPSPPPSNLRPYVRAGREKGLRRGLRGIGSGERGSEPVFLEGPSAKIRPSIRVRNSHAARLATRPRSPVSPSCGLALSSGPAETRDPATPARAGSSRAGTPG